MYQSLLGEIYRDLNNKEKAKEYYEKAIALTQSEKEKKLLNEKIVALITLDA